MSQICGAYVVTGATRGMGYELVKQFLVEGQAVIAVGRNATMSHALNSLAALATGNLIVMNCDIGSGEDVADFGKEISKHVSTIDVLINNAGLSQDKPIDNVSTIQASSIISHINVNVVGTLLVTQVLTPLFHTGSKIINMSSMCASLDLAPRRPIENVVAYSISKAALNMLTVKQAMFYTDCIVVAIDPGNVKTDMNPEAERTAEEVIGKLREVLKNLRGAMSGSFLSWEGEKLAW